MKETVKGVFMEVYVAIIEHKHGQNIYVCKSYELALREMANYCWLYWEELNLDGTEGNPKDMSDEEAVATYFDFYMEHRGGAETYSIEQTKLIEE